MSCTCPTETAPPIDTTGLTIQQRRELALYRLGRKPRSVAEVRKIRETERWSRGAGRERYTPLEPMPYTGDIVRHLHYFVWPVSGHGTWQHNLDQLLRRIDLFNGRRRMAIATSANADPPEEVQEYVKGLGFEFIIAPNNPRLREVVSFLPLLAPLESESPNELIFFAHAKGVSHGPPDDPRKVEHRWATAMYDVCLDDIGAVEEALTDHTFAGCFRVFGQFRTHFNWHFAGTFYWARSARLFAQRWNTIDKKLWGSETWPGRIVHPDDSACLFFDNFSARYINVQSWEKSIEPELEKWKSARSVIA